MHPRREAIDATLVDERHSWLREQLDLTGRITTNDAADQLGVSVDTIRRDLRALHQQGILRRVHGGALPLPPQADSFAGRTEEPSPGRAALAEAIVQRFEPGAIVGLDAGTTSVEIARRIPQGVPLTVVTNGPAVALALADHSSAQVTLLGGDVDLVWMATTGPVTVDAWRTYHLDIAVVGVCGFDPESGASTRSAAEVHTKRALIAAAAEAIVPVQADKLGTRAPFHVVGVGAIDTLLLEAGSDAETARRCRATGLHTEMA